MRKLVITYRRALVVAAHLALWTASYALAFLLRFEFEIPSAYFRFAPALLVASLVIRALVHWRLGLFHGLWRYVGAKDLSTIIKATTVSTLAFAGFVLFIHARSFPRSVFVLDWLLSIMLLGGLRFAIRMLREVAVQNAAPSPEGRRKILVLGAGDAGEMLVREMVRAYARRFQVVGFLDDDAVKQGERIHGVPVLGPVRAVVDVVQERGIDEVVIAMPSLTGKEMRAIVEKCRGSRAQIRTLPAVDQLMDGKIMNQLHEVRIEDLLGREQVHLDTDAVSEMLRGRRVLVTGAGGSIGSELCKQVARFGPARLVLVEQAENNLFYIHRHLTEHFPDVAIEPCIADICDSRRIEAIFDRERPEVVFHAAAHKHVPMMEWNAAEAIKNNVFGTKKVADLAHAYGATAFVMVSTDKAVNPTSVMGASKRAAEIYVQALSQRSKTHFVTVRFGNVLGSAGSVIPIFKEQIAKGGPVTVTHPEMRRYFMTIPEACQLVLEAGTLGRGGEIFILDMGDPVRVVDLAHDLIRLSGLTPGVDIDVVFTGLRPGEKLFEELSADAEHADKTRNPKIFVGRLRPYAWSEVERGLELLKASTDATDREPVVRALQRLVPEYHPSEASPVAEPAASSTSDSAPAATVALVATAAS